MINIPFNKPFKTEKEIVYLKKVLDSGKISGNGKYTELCQKFFEKRFNFLKTRLTTSCTDALEMIALLFDIKEGDEVIMPSYTFVSTANAFALRGAKIVFADSKNNSSNIDENKLENLITNKTKAIVVVHYGGVACEMDKILEIAKKHKLFIAEDAAQSICSSYKGRPLGSLGDLGALSFHETKNISCGEGGMLIINNPIFLERSEILWEKGTNRSQFLRGEVDKYTWVDLGSSFLPSELNAALLYAQLEQIDTIQRKRIDIWNRYYTNLEDLKNTGKIKLSIIPNFATNNAHLFYLLCKNKKEQTNLINYLKNSGIQTAFHYVPLHSSLFFKPKFIGEELHNCNKFANTLVRLPLFADLTLKEVDLICKKIHEFY